MKTIKTLLTLSVLLMLTACVSSRIEQPLPRNYRIGVLSNFEQQAKFEYVGTTLFQNTAYQHALPNFDMNKITSEVAVEILRKKGYSAVSLAFCQNNQSARFIDPGIVVPKVAKEKYSYFTQLATQQHIDAVLLIEQMPVAFNSSAIDNCSGCTEYLDGYGVFTRNFLGLGYTYIGVSYKFYLIRLNDFAILAYQDGGAVKKATRPIWKYKYEQIPGCDLNYIEQLLVEGLYESLCVSISKALSI